VQCPQFLRGLKDIVVDVEGGAHKAIITHHASDVQPAEDSRRRWGRRRRMAEIWYCNGMTTTIDKAGRVVIPAAVRERLGLLPGTPLEVTADDGAVTLAPVVTPPRLVARRGWLVARPVGDRRKLAKIDVAKLIEEERNRWP